MSLNPSTDTNPQTINDQPRFEAAVQRLAEGEPSLFRQECSFFIRLILKPIFSLGGYGLT